MRIEDVNTNRKRKGFEVQTQAGLLFFPFSKCAPSPRPDNTVVKAFVDPELGNEAITYALESGEEGSIHGDQFLEYNRDPSYLRDLLLYQLSLEAQAHVATSTLSKREIIRRLGTSATQFYRLLDQTNHSKTVDQMLRLLNVLDCDVQFVVQAKAS